MRSLSESDTVVTLCHVGVVINPCIRDCCFPNFKSFCVHCSRLISKVKDWSNLDLYSL
ncbi:MAG: hypothetical protein CL440_05080 [Acidimicrobiaceae bacterium]|nr:hypothetical protein [Acidimicrobiaceae bacterium]